MPIIIFYIFAVSILVLIIGDISSYMVLRNENKSLKKQLEKKDIEISNFKNQMEKLRYLIKYYANRDKKGN